MQVSDQTAPTPKATRGTGFPGLALDEAVEAIKKAGQYGRTHSDAAFAGYLGHASANSGPFRSKMAALRDFNLIQRPKDGQVPITDLGHEIAHPTGDERALLQQAFFSAKAFAEIYNEAAMGQDLSLDLIANRAVTTLGVSPQNKSRFAESFRKSALFAGLGRAGAGDNTIRLTPPGSVPAAPEPTNTNGKTGVTPEDPTEVSPPAAGTTSSPPAPAPPSAPLGRPPVIHQEWPVAGGRVVFEVSLDRTLPGTAFMTVGEVMQAVEKFVGTLAPVEEPTPVALPATPEEDDESSAAE
jgi:hypothetical protein